MNRETAKLEVENWINEYFKNRGSYNRKIYEAMMYSLNVGGKRIRPILFIQTYLLYKDNYRDIIPVAASLEMIHTYSLIHDDLPCMDNDDLRRGMPTNHRVFGEGIAVLAGDGLLNEAMNIMFDFCTKNNSENVLKACRLISFSSGVEGMIGGQVVDILSERREISEEELYYMHRKKTGALIKSAIVSGGILGNAEENDLDILGILGEKLGLAFQIKDDILDVIGDTKVMGKKVRSDENNDKTTFVSLYGIEKCKKLCSELTDQCIELLDKLKKDTSELKSITSFLLNREF